MGPPSEPLLPVEAPPPSRRRRWIALGAGAAGLLGIAGVLLFRRAEPPAGEDRGSRPAESVPSRAAAPEARGREGAGPRGESAEERSSRELYDAALAFDRSNPGDYEARMTRWREVMARYPASSWARQADERYRAASASLQTLLDREFEATRKDAQTLAAAGHFVDAIDTLQSYRSSQTRDLLRRRAEVEISAIENASRLAYNEAIARCRDLAAKGDFRGAIPLVDSVARGAIPEVAARCQKSISELQQAAAARDQFEETRRGDDARKAFREEVAPKILGLVRARRYDDALRDLGAAGALPGNAAIREDIAAERASVADASAFWEAFLRALRSRLGQEASLLQSDGKRSSGKIARIQDDRIVVESGDTATEIPLDRLHADLLVGWTLGKTLAAEDGLSYVKAALFFFCEGRDDLARLYLATARELNGPAEAAEKVFRGGFLRAAAAARK